MSTTTTIITPYHPPTSPTPIHHVALSSKSFRVFGLNSPAWKNARKDRRKAAAAAAAAAEGGSAGSTTAVEVEAVSSANDDCSDSSDSGDGIDCEEEEAGEMALICNAVTTALEEDAGGFGTAGRHVSKVDIIQQPSSSSSTTAAVFHAKLIPCNDKTKEPVLNDISTILAIDEAGTVKYVGNDEFYMTHSNDNDNNAANGQSTTAGTATNTNCHFQLRITVSKAKEGLAANKYYNKLFAKRKELNDGTNGSDDADDPHFNDLERWVSCDDDLKDLQQSVIDAKEEGNHEGRGYHVEILLVEPHVNTDEVVIAPSSQLDKTHRSPMPTTTTKSVSERNLIAKSTQQNTTAPARQSIFHTDAYASRQFTSPIGPWEQTNLQSFTNIALDLRKSLVRAEFPVFPQGCAAAAFREVYQLNARLKSGSFATVCRGTHRATGRKVAIKCVLRRDLPPGDDAAIYDEVLIMSTLRHGYICPLIDFFEEEECYFLVMELMSGGDLFDRIGRRKSYTEKDARDLCRKMLECLSYCHENHIAHCDMKPNNLLLTSDDDDVTVKLGDFGFATRVYEPASLTKQCGTPFFVAPEILMRSPYDQQSDMWSCGVIMFLLLGGDLPFSGRNQKELFRSIVFGKYEFEGDGWAHISEQAKDLVKQLLVPDPSQRLTSHEAMASPWMRQRGNMLIENHLKFTSQRLKGFNARMKLKASMLAVSSVVSMRMSLMSLKSASESSVSNAPKSVEAKKVPAFLDLPDEGTGDSDSDSDDEED